VKQIQPRLLSFFFAFFGIALATLVSFAESRSAVAPVPATDPDATASASVSVGFVVVPFIATDKKGRPIRDLDKKEVTLRVEGRRVPLEFFDHNERSPVSFTILLDGSGSMGIAGKKEGAMAALAELVKRKLPKDEFALHVFASGEIRELVSFTEDGASVLRAAESVKPYGKTAFFDALAVMPGKSLVGQNGSRAIVLLTDGFDNASVLSAGQLASLLEGIDVPVYPLGLWTEGEETPAASDKEARVDLDILERIAKSSGGRLAVADTVEKLTKAIGAIERDLRTQYVTGFAPSSSGEEKFRRIKVEVDRSDVKVRVRAGYRGTAPPSNGNR